MKAILREKPPQKRKLWHRILCSILAVTMVLTGMTVFPQSRDTVRAEDLSMTVDSRGNITWDTSSHKSNATVRFRTIGWYFRFSSKDARTGKWEQSPNKPVLVELLNGDIVSKEEGRTSKVGTYDGSNDPKNGTARMSYTITGLKKYYSGEDREYQIYADARVEFYRIKSSGSTETIKTVSNKADADAEAKRLGMGNGPYFENYYNRKVNIPRVRLAVTGDSHLVSPLIDSSRGNAGTETKAEQWVEKNTSHELQISAKEEFGLKGYACVSATDNRTGERITGRDGFIATSDQGGLIKKYGVGSSNASVTFHSKPLQVKVHFYNEGKELGSQTYTFDKYSDLASTDKLISSVGKLGVTGWFQNEDLTGKFYGTHQEVDKQTMMSLYQQAGKFNPNEEVRGGAYVLTHEVNLYARTGNILKIKPDFYIIYNGNGATSGTMDKQPVERNKDTMLTHIKYKKTGYHYNKTNTWKTKKSGKYYKDCQTVNSSTLDFDDGIKKTVTLYAQWDPNKCKIQYDGNGSDGGMPVEPQTITYDKWTQTIHDCTYTKGGKTSGAGWNTRPDGSGTGISAGTKIDKTLWNKLFGENGNGKTVTLYAQWNGGNTGDDPDPEIKQVGDGDLTYRSGETGMNQSYGPEKYDINGDVVLKKCMFGTSYDENTAKVKKKSNGIWVDGEYTNHETDYLIRSGSTVLDEFGKYYTFKGWSVDKNAVWSKSQNVIRYPDTITGGRDLAYTYYGYVNPVKGNDAWAAMGEDDPVPAPTTTLFSIDAGNRAGEICTSRDTWMQYESLLNAKITTQSNKKVEYKNEMEKYKQEIEDKEKEISSVYFPGTPSVSYPIAPPKNATKEEKQAYEDALSIYNSAWNSYYSSYNQAAKEKAALEDELEEYKYRYNVSKEKYEKAKALLKETVKTLNGLYEDITKTIRVSAGTYLYAVWDQYPEFDEIDPIHVFKSDDYSYMTDEWLLNYVHVTDREDGELKKGTSVVVENFDPDDLKQLQHTGASSVTFRATDSAGNVTRYTVTVVVEDRTPLEKTTPDDLSGKLYYETGYPRFICRESFEIGDPDSPNYYGSGYNGTTTNMYGQKVPVYLYVGGLHPESRWYTDPAWKKEIYQGFENEENDTPEEVWEFSHQDILDIQKYIDDNGLGDMNGEGYLDKFYQEFAPRCQTEYHADRIGY